jgi:hypothetical protein
VGEVLLLPEDILRGGSGREGGREQDRAEVHSPPDKIASL